MVHSDTYSELCFRQVHLDFHTSPAIPEVGKYFDAEFFAETMAKARVNSVNCFARCHHGMVYYRTSKFPERKHPHLKRNILAEQIDALHKRDIKAPIYITVQWDHFTAEEHPEWIVLDPAGKYYSGGYWQGHYKPGFYRYLCLNSPYTNFLHEFVKEVLTIFDADGLWFDIVRPMDCSCRYCRKSMEQRGLDPSNETLRKSFGVEVLHNFTNSMTDFVRSINKNCKVFYNSGHISPVIKPMKNAYSHFEIESLPSGGWGYTHFPFTVRYARNLGLDYLGMTGKFHAGWGDFHSLKNRAALEYECFYMLAANAKCSIGDQLHPNGKISKATYDLVGSVYKQVEEKEPWCSRATSIKEVGVLMTSTLLNSGHSNLNPSVVGVVRILQELGRQFEILDEDSFWGEYKLIILPDNVRFDNRLSDQMSSYIEKGGAVILTGSSGLTVEGDKFISDKFGVELIGDAPYCPDFIVPKGDIGKGLYEVEYVMELAAKKVMPLNGSDVLADIAVPYFNREWNHFCSHKYTPSSGTSGYPGIIRNNKAIYFAHPIFSIYKKNAPIWIKTLVDNAITMLIGCPTISHNGPSSMIACLNEQLAERRLILHLLHYIPERRGEEFDTIEDIIPLFNIKIEVRLKNKAEDVCLVPQKRPIAFAQDQDILSFVVPEISGHQMVSVSLSGGK